MQQYIGDGASLFITIVACIIGFLAAVGKLDQMKTEKENPKEE
ncbi:hypothetical protein [Fulvivirga sp.]|jgi:hypothetical protein